MLYTLQAILKYKSPIYFHLLFPLLKEFGHSYLLITHYFHISSQQTVPEHISCFLIMLRFPYTLRKIVLNRISSWH